MLQRRRGGRKRKIRERLVRSASLIPRLFAPHNILLSLGLHIRQGPDGPKQKLILFNGNVAIRRSHMYKLGALD